MDSKRLILAAGLTVLILWLYQAWLEYQYPAYYQQQESQEQTAQAPQTDAKEPQSSATSETESSAGGSSAVPEMRQEEAAASTSTPQVQRQTTQTASLRVSTDVLELAFSGQSGDPIGAELKAYRKEDRPDSPPVSVLAPRGERVAMTQTGWLNSSEGGPEATHQTAFQGPQTDRIELKEDQDKLQVTFSRTVDGVEFRKTYHLRRGSYAVPVEFQIRNNSDQTWQGHLYGQFRNRGHKAGSWILYDYDGPVVFAQDEMQTFSPSALAEREGSEFRADDATGWAGVMSRYFLTAWVPAEESGSTIYARGVANEAYPGFASAFPAVAPGEQTSVTHKLYLGPKDQSLLEEQGRHLRRSVDYGILSFLAIPLFEVMQFFHSLVGNYGYAIILVTLLIKLLFFPLFSMSYRAMAKMRKVQPELQRIRENYGDDRQKMNEEMMRLYKEEKVNPLGGCLPILVQIPVFISLYWVLLESVEIRHEPFIFWITDLTSQDPFYVLPVLMGASMVVQQMLNPAPLDPVQKKVMMALPVVFTVFFIQFPAGLVLYWLSNNLISIAQQWWIMRKTA